MDNLIQFRSNIVTASDSGPLKDDGFTATIKSIDNTVERAFENLIQIITLKVLMGDSNSLVYATLINEIVELRYKYNKLLLNDRENAEEK